MGVVPVVETSLVLSIGSRPGAGHLLWVESQMMSSLACSTRYHVNSLLYEGGVGGLLFLIDLSCHLTPATFPLLMLHDLSSKQSML